MFVVSAIILASAAAVDAGGAFGLRDLFMCLQALGMFYLGVKQRRIDTLEDRVEQKAEQLVAARVEGVVGRLEEITRRLDQKDGAINALVVGDHGLEIKLMREVKAISDFVRDNCASKHDVEQLNGRFDGLQQAVARAMVERLEHGKAHK